MTEKELVETPPSVYCGGEFREKKYNKLLYGNMHGEDIVTKENNNWAEDFIYRFATYQVPCHFLNSHKRLAINGKGSNLSCIFSDGIVSYAKGEKITLNNKLIKDGDTWFLPFVHKEKQYIAYSAKGDIRIWDIPEKNVKSAKIYRISENGNKFIKEIEVLNNKIELFIKPKTALLIKFE